MKIAIHSHPEAPAEHETTLLEFARDNDSITLGDLASIYLTLSRGNDWIGGGSAAPMYVLRRVES